MQTGNPKNKFCRLCLCAIVNTSFEPIEEVLDVLTIVLPVVNLKGEGSEHVICETCYAKLFAALRFKSICLDTEDAIFPYITSEENSAIDLKEVYLKEKGKILSENQKICRLCFQLITYDFVSLYEVDVNIMVNYLAQININTTKDPLLCGPCFESLCIHGSFLLNCRETFEKYTRDEAVKNEIKEGESDMHSNLKSEKIKIDQTCLDVQEQYEQPYIKTEEINIKAEESNEESDNLSNDLSRATTVNNERPRHSTIIPESVHKCEVREVQENERKSKIQESESSVQAKLKSIRQDLLSHQALVRIDLHKCKECNYVTKYEKVLKHHLLTHKEPSKPQIYECDVCHYKTKYKGYLKRHKIKHEEVGMYTCDTCDYESKYRAALKNHLLVHKDSSEVQMFKCELCGYETKHKRYIKVHVLRHGNNFKNRNVQVKHVQS